MCVLTIASTIFALLALTRAAPVCEELVKPLHVEDLTPMMGKWWFLSGFSDNQSFRNILKVSNSSWITLTPSGQAESFIMSHGNKIDGKCEFATSNITLKSGVLHAKQMAEGNLLIFEVTILPSGLDYLTVKHKMVDLNITSLYLFGRSAKLSETEQQAFQRQAECLGYSSPAPYTYDGVTELCDPKHKLMCEPLIKHQEIKNTTQLMGRWVFLMGFVDHKIFHDLLKIASSGWMGWTLSPETDMISISQGNRLNGQCMITSSNGTISDSVFRGSAMYAGHLMTTEGWFLPSGTDILVMYSKSQSGDQNIWALYMFGRSSKASATDFVNVQKQAECLGWIGPAHYAYDGVTELCEKSPESSEDKVVD
ncbi:saxitoxin and tetrodotoxin-binding protein 1-like [Alosa sapidissima]|uniref:saxitoxin and tetrodotoxin-binding protein 1-like n=1 Tax=Alosa sapidissima TaxID=34773 RepID=UPI001C086609|nr:saxitoxin and tetrodotoxin-binding protein 1-like [Alosa sapidissima]